MKIKSYYLVVLFIISMVGFQMCDPVDINDTNETNGTNGTTSGIKIILVDAEGIYDKVLVNIIDVQYNRSDDDEGWTTFESFSLPETADPLNRIDLTELIAGNTVVLTDEDIESGNLSRIRLVLGDDNALVLEGESDEIPLKTPSAQQSGLKIHMNTELVPGFSYTFILDWDVQKSIVEAGKSGQFILKPVIRAIAEVNSGTIFGRVADIEETEEGADSIPIVGAVLFVFDESDTEFETVIATTETDEEGIFMIQGIPAWPSPINYVLMVTKEAYDDFFTDPILVEAGVETDVGTIHLTKSTGEIIGMIEPDSIATLIKAYILDLDPQDTLTTTSDEGEFSIDSVPEATYQILFMPDTASIYKDTLVENIVVPINVVTDIGTIDLHEE